MSTKSIADNSLRSPLHHFLSHIPNFRCIIFSKTAPESGASTKSTLGSRLHPSDATPSVFTPSVCESQFDLIHIFCWYENKNVSGIYRTSIMRIGEAGFEQLANVVSFSVADTIFPPKCIFLPRGDVIQNVTNGKNRDKYTLFVPKLFAHTSSGEWLSFRRFTSKLSWSWSSLNVLKKRNIDFLTVAILARDVCRCI